MNGCLRLVLFLILATQLAACTFGGGGDFLSSQKITLGVPTKWLVNEEVHGRVLDLASCEGSEDAENEIFSFYPDKCSPVANAEVVLIVGGYGSKEYEFRYTTRTDADGRFHFERHTAIRLFDEHNGNSYNSGTVLITAEGYPLLREPVSWRDPSPITKDWLAVGEDEIRDFVTGKIENMLILFLTPPQP